MRVICHFLTMSGFGEFSRVESNNATDATRGGASVISVRFQLATILLAEPKKL